MKTITYRGEALYLVPAPVPERCDGCRFVAQCGQVQLGMPCVDVQSAHNCYEEWDDKPAQDHIFIPATDEALAKWVNWRMNGYTDGSEDA
jgi:hypothetical protein